MILLIDRAEEAMAALITLAVAGLDIVPEVVTGKSSGDKELPLVVCVATGSGEEEVPFTGNFWVEWTIQIKHSAVDNENEEDPAPATARSADQALVNAVFGAVSIATLATDLSDAVDDFTVFPGSVLFGAPDRFEDDQGVWVDELKVRALACASAIPA